MMSLVAMYRSAGVFGVHGRYREVAEKGIEALVVLGELVEVPTMSRELKDLGLVGAVKVAKGAGRVVVREKVKVVAELADNFWNGLEEE
jgi:dihydrodipicolinate synthase/N-acetylneuraminate lyase